MSRTFFPPMFNLSELPKLASFSSRFLNSLIELKGTIASESNNLSPEIQSQLLNLDVFRHLEGAVRLLMLQPRKKKQTPDDYDEELESNVSTMSSSSVLSSLSGVDIDGYDIDVLNDKTIPNRQKWLDLRLRGGKSKKGLLPFCLKVQEMKWSSWDIYCEPMINFTLV